MTAGTVGSFLDLADDQPLPPFGDDEAWADATVSADELAEILTSPDLTRHHKGVRLAGLRITPYLDLEEARLDRFLMLRRCQLGPWVIILTNAATRGISLSGSACDGVFADGASITGDVVLEGFNATGEVRLLGAQIGGQLSCRGATLANAEGYALIADGASITGGVFLDEGFNATGEVSFVNARAGVLVDSKADWPRELRIDGFRYDALHSDGRGWKDRREWLRRQVEPSPGPYLQLAAVYRARGDDVDARKILMERHSDLIHRDRPERWQPHYPRRRTRSWRRFLGVTIGHGYEPWRALYFLLPLLVAMAAWYGYADGQNLLVPNDQVSSATSSQCTNAYPCVQPLVYAADTLIPVVDLGQRSKWTPDVTARGPSRYFFDDGRWLATATWVANVLGWIFATLIIAGFSNIIRKE